RAADAVHHRMDRRTWRVRRRSVSAMGRDFVVCLLCRLRPAPDVVAELVRCKIAPGQPRAGLEPDDVQPGLGEGRGGDATDRPESDDDDVSFLQSGGHRSCLLQIRLWRTPW